MLIRNKKGIVLVSAIVVLTFLTGIGLSLIALVLSRVLKAELEVKRLKAFYLAEAGIAASISELKKDVDQDRSGTGEIPPTKLKGGTYSALVDQSLGIITGIGECEGVHREVEIKYRTL